MFFGIRDLVLHPDAFFETVSKEKVNLIPPVVIVGAGLFISFMIAVVYYSLISGNNLHYVGWMAIIQVFFRCTAVIPLIVWGVISLGTYGISWGCEGKGSLAATVQNIGYGMLPWIVFIIGSVIFSGLSFVIFHSTSPADMTLGAIIFHWADIIFGLVIFFWGWYLWILAVRYTHGFTLRKAAAVTIVPVAIVIWLTIPVQAWIETIRMIISGA
jgi:hypothetical protein